VTDSELHPWVESLLGPSADRIAAGTTLQRLAALEPEHLGCLIEALADFAAEIDHSDPAILGGLLLAIQQLAAKQQASETGDQEDSASANEAKRRLQQLPVDAVERIAEALPAEVPNRHRLLYLLAANRSPDSLAALARQLAATPPGQWVEVGQVLSPLMQHDDWDPDAFYPAALDGLAHASVAAPVMDLANFLLRRGRVATHPASSRRESLATLLGVVAGRLSKFEEEPRTLGDSVEQVQSVLNEAVALAVSLCDALGLIGWDGATGKLYQAMELRHRRVQCEAAGALASLGDEEGKKRLLALAAEPSARLRAIAYAEELGLADQIDDQFKTNESLAEADMALWLSQPANMAVPPTAVEVIDSRTQYWPGFERPIDCYLVRFEYQFGDRIYSNVGITGPATHVVAADLADLPTEDIYAVYAGWQAEHEDLFTVQEPSWNAAQRRIANPLIEALDRKGFEQIEPALLGFFLDEHALVAQANRDDASCIVVTDGLETIDVTTAGRIRPMGPEELWYLFLGRKMLRTFNR
jgi:hypothetical protein